MKPRTIRRENDLRLRDVAALAGAGVTSADVEAFEHDRRAVFPVKRAALDDAYETLAAPEEPEEPEPEE